jgi:hypothetical protein
VLAFESPHIGCFDEIRFVAVPAVGLRVTTGQAEARLGMIEAGPVELDQIVVDAEVFAMATGAIPL